MTDPVIGWSRRRFLGVAAAAPVLAAAACATSSGADSSTDSEVAVPPPGGGARRLPYGTEASQVGDLWLPPGEGPFPVVVLVHGGFWRADYGLSLMDDLAADVVATGWAAWNVEYRRVGEDGGGWPGTFRDVAAAIDHLGPLADQGEPVDLARIAVAGHSAGGHLAAWAATRPGLQADAPGASPVVTPIAVVSQAGVLDLERAATEGVGGSAVSDLLGGSPGAHPDRYQLASPQARLPTGIPIRCVHGRQDQLVPFDQSADYVAAAVAAGDEAVLGSFDGDHFAILDPTDTSWTDTIAWLRPRFRP